MELGRFLDAQNQVHFKALLEITNGKKETHWMWYIFPKIRGLGISKTSQHYGIKNIEEAEAFLAHPVLGKHLVEITEALLQVENKTAAEIFGAPDDMKLRSCATLFSNVKNAPAVFRKVIEKYFGGVPDELTLQMIQKKFRNLQRNTV